MQSDFYSKGFKKAGLEVITPSEEHQNIINDIIFGELVIHKFLDESRKKFIEIINSYNVDGVILACTELPLLLNQSDTQIRLLNPSLLHCQAALQFSLNP
jgi:aspartate racemase